MTEFKVGQTVRITDDEQFARREGARTNAGFEELMVDCLGRVGTVKNIVGNVLVDCGSDPLIWWWPPSCLEPANLLDFLIEEATQRTGA